MKVCVCVCVFVLVYRIVKIQWQRWTQMTRCVCTATGLESCEEGVVLRCVCMCACMWYVCIYMCIVGRARWALSLRRLAKLWRVRWSMIATTSMLTAKLWHCRVVQCCWWYVCTSCVVLLCSHHSCVCVKTLHLNRLFSSLLSTSLAQCWYSHVHQRCATNRQQRWYTIISDCFFTIVFIFLLQYLQFRKAFLIWWWRHWLPNMICWLKIVLSIAVQVSFFFWKKKKNVLKFL